MMRGWTWPEARPFLQPHDGHVHEAGEAFEPLQPRLVIGDACGSGAPPPATKSGSSTCSPNDGLSGTCRAMANSPLSNIAIVSFARQVSTSAAMRSTEPHQLAVHAGNRRLVALPRRQQRRRIAVATADRRTPGRAAAGLAQRLQRRIGLGARLQQRPHAAPRRRPRRGRPAASGVASWPAAGVASAASSASAVRRVGAVKSLFCMSVPGVGGTVAKPGRQWQRRSCAASAARRPRNRRC